MYFHFHLHTHFNIKSTQSFHWLYESKDVHITRPKCQSLFFKGYYGPSSCALLTSSSVLTTTISLSAYRRDCPPGWLAKIVTEADSRIERAYHPRKCDIADLFIVTCATHKFCLSTDVAVDARKPALLQLLGWSTRTLTEGRRERLVVSRRWRALERHIPHLMASVITIAH